MSNRASESPALARKTHPENTIVQSVRITGPDNKQTSGEVTIRVWDKAARTRRALKFLGICWGLSLISIVLPIAHFVLVPGFFLAGPIGAYWMYHSTSVVLGGHGTCPSCGAKLQIARSADKWPLSDLCTHCQKAVTIEKADS